MSISGEVSFNADTFRQLIEHSTGTKSTYAYYFTEIDSNSLSFVPLPSWLGNKSNHGDEIPFVFGSPYNEENSLEKCIYVISTYCVKNWL